MIVKNFSDLDLSKEYTYADYLLWQFQDRVELIKGKVFRMSPAPNLRHQTIATELTRQFANYFLHKPCQVFASPFDVRMPRTSKKNKPDIVIQPDLCVVCDPEKLDEQGCNGAPDFIIEVLSPGNTKREMKEKFEVYEEAGVKEYWLVNPTDKVVLIYVLNDAGKFIGLQPATEDDILHPTIFPGIKLNLFELFNGVPTTEPSIAGNPETKG